MFQSIFKNKLLPAVTLTEADAALRVAEAFLEAGLTLMEITFRTQSAAASISAITTTFSEMHVGAGTILTTENLKEAADSGAGFGLAPCYNKIVAGKARFVMAGKEI